MNARVFVIVLGALLAKTTTSSGAMYIIAINPGPCNLIANELNHALGNNVNNVMAGVPAVALTLSKFISPVAGYQIETYDPDLAAWEPGVMTLNPGEAAFLNSPMAFNLVFTGTLPANQPCPTLVGGQSYLVSRRRGWADTGLGPSPYKDIVGYDPAPGSTLHQFVPGGDCAVLAAPNYTVYTFAGGAWSPEPPMIPPGRAVWITVPSDLPQSYNIAIAAGACNLIANELNACGGNNINNVLPASGLPAALLTLSKFVSPAIGYQIETYDPEDGTWAPGAMTLNPGEGAFLNSPMAFNLTFRGNLPAAQPCKTMTPGLYYLLSRRAAGLGPSTYQQVVGAPPLVGSVLYRFVGGDCSVLAAPNYSVHTYEGGGVWAGGVPAISVGQSVWVTVPAAGPVLTIGFGAPCLAEELKLTWDGGWQLQSADLIVGPWSNVPGAASPYCYAPVLPVKFFRLVCP